MSWCVAYEEDGKVCRGRGEFLDVQSGGMVCARHYLMGREGGRKMTGASGESWSDREFDRRVEIAVTLRQVREIARALEGVRAANDERAWQAWREVSAWSDQIERYLLSVRERSPREFL